MQVEKDTIFPLVKRFQDVKTSPMTVMLKEEATFYEKSFRSGTILFVIGWKEILGKPFLILNKGSWEGLVKYEEISTKLLRLNGE